ncbi:MAG: PrsW family intramembrane metalloprotease [Dysgonamonadaceae bacterium]|jgi:RsiW-degrading membrane proteinase PrsW (M82 family)|nr:PrsW family intramembrane metalloprotease [Dysgonamonadaceae bacterium]
MYYIIRNNQQFGPYSIDVLAAYVENGKILRQDRAFLVSNPQLIQAVGYFLKSNNKKVKIKHQGSVKQQLKDIGRELIIPNDVFSRKAFMKDNRLLWLALIGLAPAFLIGFFSAIPVITFYVISLYFSVIWGLFFFYLFKTPQISTKKTIFLFFALQILVFVVWDILHLPAFPGISILYGFTRSENILLQVIGFIFGVGLLEELAKALPLLLIARRAKEPYIPQSLVFYGLMSGIAFGVFEGVQYQMTTNTELDYANAFFMNVARLTSLPFLHAIWAGMAGYFIAFASLYPKYRRSLYLLAILIPATLHGLYDVLGWSVLGLLLTLLSVVLLMSYLKQGVSYQSKLSR